jgi:glycosyltransferase involved in cell wall biosynthesis
MPGLYKNRAIITVSESSKREILDIGLAESGNISIIHPGIDVNKFVRTEKAPHQSILYLGRLKPYKCIDVAIKAFAEIAHEFPQATFTIAGTGESMRRLQELTVALGIQEKVLFLGAVSEEKKVQLLGKSWIVVQPSMIEGWGITVIESNACGTPVIASNVNGLKDSIVNLKTGILVPARDIQAFANAMRECLTNTALREKLSQQAYMWSGNFSWDKSAEAFDNLLPRSKEIQKLETKKALEFAGKEHYV